MSRVPAYLTGSCLLLAVAAASGQDRPFCQAGLDTGLSTEAFFADWQDDPTGTITFEAGSVEADIGESPRVVMSGGVLVKRGDRLAGADSANYDPDTMSLSLDGQVRYQDPLTQIIGRSARLSYSTGTIRFEGAEFQLGAGSRGSASELEISEQGTLHLAGVTYTTCPPGSNDWLLVADDIQLDTNEGQGTARKVALRFQGVPILYAPRLTFPLGDARKTGFLAPEFGSSGRSGNEIRSPWYWNIRENYDATLTPRLLTERGLQLGTEFRYLTERSDGTAEFEYLSNDTLFGDTRSYLEYRHRTLFENGWRNLIDFRETSDTRYFEDLGGSLATTSITHLNRIALLDYYGRTWSFVGRMQDYQTIDEAIVPEDEPYRQLPNLRVSASVPDRWLGFRTGFDSELVNFDRKVGVTGWRFDARGLVDWSLEQPGWFVTPTVILQHTRYDLDNTEPGQRTDPSRTLPIASIDTGLIFERPMRSAGDWIQTLEPRMQYVHIPFREQSDLPVFDTIEPDLNLVQLFRRNRFLGVDRIVDTDQLSVGVTSRILNSNTGEEIFSATVGQALYLSESGVSLPTEELAAIETSDYIAEVRFLLYENFNFEVGHQWGDGQIGTTRSEARLQYRPAGNKILNLAYRYRRGSLEQSDISWSWPVASSWNFVGRYNYSLREQETLEQFYGFEYESCCWGLRAVYRRYVSTRDGTQDSSFGLQLVLKGMASVGTRADRVLERGILGYSRSTE
ncbi:MAG: LPS assembly protein LptD [Gammaproteobacteria bacterium]|nr:LPS assembly protein LptD [Gammaproteobacteria bacterium]